MLSGELGGRGGLRGGPVDDHHLFRTGIGEAEHDVSGRAACAEHRYAATAWIKAEGAREVVEQALAVGAVGERLPVAYRHAVRCAEQLDPARSAVASFGDRVLVRRRHRNAD